MSFTADDTDAIGGPEVIAPFPGRHRAGRPFRFANDQPGRDAFLTNPE